MPYLLLALLGIVAATAAYQRFSGRAEPAPVPTAPAPTLAPPTAPELEAVLSGARRALDEGAYEEASRMSDLALRLEPANPAAQALRDRVTRAWEAEKSLGLWEAPASPPGDPGRHVDPSAAPR